MGARDVNNRMVSPHVRLFPHNIYENPSYSLISTIRCSFAIPWLVLGSLHWESLDIPYQGTARHVDI